MICAIQEQTIIAKHKTATNDQCRHEKQLKLSTTSSSNVRSWLRQITYNDTTIAKSTIPMQNDHNICRKLFERTDLAVEIKTVWRITNVEIVTIIIGATGTMYNNFEKDIGKLKLEQVNKSISCTKRK